MSRYSILAPVRNPAHLRDLVAVLVMREIKIRYKDSTLGLAWSILNPVLHLLIFFFLFQLIFSLDIRRYSSFAFTGLLVWTWFQASLNQAVIVIKGNADLVGQPGFPAAVLPVVSVTTHLIHFLLALPLLLVILFIEGAEPSVALLLLPVLLGIQFAMTLSLAYYLAAVNVRFRDMQHILAVLLQLYFFVTPIFYNLETVPEKYRLFFLLNPMVHLLEAYRAVLMWGQMPDWTALSVIALISLVLLVLGFEVFTRSSYRFMEEL